MQKIINGFIVDVDVWFDNESNQAVISEWCENSDHTYITKQDLLNMLKLFEERGE